MKLKTLVSAVLIGLFALVAAVPVAAQTATTSTTLSSAATASATTVVVASATNVTAGGSLYIDRELMSIVSVSSTTVRVIRGAGGTRAAAHGANAVVYAASQAQAPYVFVGYDKTGSCTATNEQMLPQINVGSGAILQCASAAGLWYNIRDVVTVACATGPLATGSVDQSCATIDRAMFVVGITYVSAVVESAGTLTIIRRRQQSTEAPASGDALATAISGVSTVAQTVTSFTLSTTPALLLLSSGERLGLDFTDDVAGELAGVVVTFTLAAR